MSVPVASVVGEGKKKKNVGFADSVTILWNLGLWKGANLQDR